MQENRVLPLQPRHVSVELALCTESAQSVMPKLVWALKSIYLISPN